MVDLKKIQNTNSTDQSPVAFKHWEACLNLDFAKQNHRTYLASNAHKGPLVLQKSLHPEGDGICHGVVVHPPGGVAGGDSLTLNVNVSQYAHALLTTPGAGKWYKANGKAASQHLQFEVQQGACFEWLPQENILFDGADVKMSTIVNLNVDAQYVGWEVMCFGRQAQHEKWITGGLQQHLGIRRNGQLIWSERNSLKPEYKLMHSIVGLGGNAVSASFVVVAGAVPLEILEACRLVKPKVFEDLEAIDVNAKYGVTALPEIFSARYIGQSSQGARQYFELLWGILRPWYARREAIRPRIWNT